MDPSSKGKLSILMVKGKQTLIGIGETAKNYKMKAGNGGE